MPKNKLTLLALNFFFPRFFAKAIDIFYFLCLFLRTSLYTKILNDMDVNF